ncbi:hypothetical protein KY284_023082 [Solanum tuberosum]|nr:hypothetical protein KY284_023082 [Solanum tuberosum]
MEKRCQNPSKKKGNCNVFKGIFIPAAARSHQRSGKGASGGVYSGIVKLEDEEVEVAVKKLGNGIEKGDDKEFLSEASAMKKSNRPVVYELLKNGTVKFDLSRWTKTKLEAKK